jgi:GntR family transcriptional regulator
MIQVERYVPKYARLEADIRQKILGGELVPGVPIPSEAVLSKQYGVSRVTVRQALARLRYAGLLESERGRGTFVARPKVIHPLNTIRSFEEKMVAQGVVVDHKLLAFSLETPSGQVRARLELEEGERVYRLERLRIVYGREVGLERHFIPAQIAEQLDKNRLGTAPVLQLVEEAGGRHARRMQITIGCGKPTREETRRLGISRGTPLLVREHIFLGEDGRPFLCGRNIFTELYQLRLELEQRDGQVLTHEWYPTVSPRKEEVK